MRAYPMRPEDKGFAIVASVVVAIIVVVWAILTYALPAGGASSTGGLGISSTDTSSSGGLGLSTSDTSSSHTGSDAQPGAGRDAQPGTGRDAQPGPASDALLEALDFSAVPVEPGADAGAAVLSIALQLGHGTDAASGEVPSAQSGGEAAALGEDDHVWEVVCWGDSLTQGVGADYALIEGDLGLYDASFKSYPEILEELCGLPVYNFGVSGASSDEIVAMHEGLTIEAMMGCFEVYDWGVAGLGQQHPGDIAIVEIGSNGGWGDDYRTLIDQCWDIIEDSGGHGYIVVGDTDDPGTSLADTNQEPFEEGTGVGETAWEQALHAEFGGHFINMRAHLIEHGLELCGIEGDEYDEELASRGCVPWQLRSDWTHLNSYGYYAKARGIFDLGVALGYWPALDGTL